MAGIGTSLRAIGDNIDKFGLSLQGNWGHVEKLSRSTNNVKFEDSTPSTAAVAFVAPNSCIVGDVSCGASSSIWYGASLRATAASIRIGSKTNIQERACITASSSPTVIGEGVVVGANVQICSSILRDECVVGANARLMGGATVEKHAMVAPGALVLANQVIPSGQLWVGSPAAYERDLTAAEITMIQDSAAEYVELAEAHAFECKKTFEELEQEVDEAEFKLRLESPHHFDPAIEDGRRGRIYNRAD